MGRKTADVLIIDYQMSNLHSVEAACRYMGLTPLISSDPKLVAQARALILPGVGAFGQAMNSLDQLGLTSAIARFIETGRPFLGICLGLQLLLTESNEFGNHQGLDIIPGQVQRFTADPDTTAKLLVPQIGWNSIQKDCATWDDTLLSGIPENELMYFVHSFYGAPIDPSVCIGQTEYAGTRYCSAIRKDNVSAFQFHPEKSGSAGLAIYRNFRRQID